MPPTTTGRRTLGMAMRFNVVIDGANIGDWSSCKGLGFTSKVHKVYEGGGYDFQHILFVDVDYQKLKLERAVDAVSSKALQTWLATALRTQPGMAAMTPGKATATGKTTATITLYDASCRVVVSTWNLRGVYPTEWSGPDLNASKSSVAVERLELQYEGFL